MICSYYYTLIHSVSLPFSLLSAELSHIRCSYNDSFRLVFSFLLCQSQHFILSSLLPSFCLGFSHEVFLLLYTDSFKLVSSCCILTFDLAKHAIPRWCTGRKWHISMAVMRRNRVGRLAEIWDKVKIPWYSHRLMHQKRVTCELHDSYFHLMMSKHAIPKIEWAIELLYNSVKTGSQRVGDQKSQRQDVVEKATTRQKGPSGPQWVGD